MVQYLLAFLFSNHIAEDEIAGWFTVSVLLLSCGYLFSVSLLRCTVGGSVIVEFPDHNYLFYLLFLFNMCVPNMCTYFAWGCVFSLDFAMCCRMSFLVSSHLARVGCFSYGKPLNIHGIRI